MCDRQLQYPRRCHGNGNIFLFPTVVNEVRSSQLIHYIATNRGKEMTRHRIHFLECKNLHALPSKSCGVLCCYSIDNDNSWDLAIALQVHPSAVLLMKVYPNRYNVSRMIHQIIIILVSTCSLLL
jgi:hypothetical protein